MKENFIFKYNSEKSVRIYNRVLTVLLQIPFTIFILFMIVYPICIDILKNKPLPFGSPWLFIIVYPILIVITDFIATIVHELGHVLFGFFSGRKFHSIIFFGITIEYSLKTKKICYYYDNNRLIRDRFIALGSAGMIPNVKYSPFKDIIYYLGGSILNLIVWLLSFIFYGNSIFSLVMLYSSFSTLIPYRYSSTTGGSDGYYIISTLFSDEARKIYEIQNEVARYLFLDVKFKVDKIFRISECLINSKYLNNKYLAYLLLVKFYINNEDYLKAIEYINKMKEMKEILLNGEAFWYDEDEIKVLEDKILFESH